ncbi:hypothetical protein [Alteromonas sp. 14N.309.X.WAT.G.H12]|uniref:hypothetical protein n=1 Tax=Alteromonas sp. 14N.309.X.WAT.G.H12 TaxID=3120824 RepID=UPI002FCF6B49
MDEKSEHLKYMSQMVNAHKVANILMPLIEALEINHNTESIAHVSLPDLLKCVVETGGKIVESLSERHNFTDTSLISDKLFLTLAKSLRNSVVMFNMTSLQLMESEIKDVFDECAPFLTSFCAEAIKDVSERHARISEVERTKLEMDIQGYVIGSLSRMFMPVWLFHTSLRTSGHITGVDTIVDLNVDASRFLFELLFKMVEKVTAKKQPDDIMFYSNTLFLASEIITTSVHDFNHKLVKNQKSLERYLASPSEILQVLVEPISANFIAMNNVTKSILAKRK